MYGFLKCGNNTDGGEKMKQRLIKFLKKNGFLLFLFICVCVVAAGTIYVSTRDFKAQDKGKLDDLIILDENGEKSSDIQDVITKDEHNEQLGGEEVWTGSKTDEKSEELESKDETNIDSEPDIPVLDNLDDLEFVDDEDDDDNEKVDEDVELVTENLKGAILPVEGEIITDFTKDTLIYSKTLEEWRSHNGIDIKANEGSKVKAPLDGIVKDVYEDELWGIVIVIDHGDGLETKLTNLGTKEMVKPGLKVNRGDHISTIGKTADIEMELEPHIHYEIRKNGKIIDPRSISK